MMQDRNRRAFLDMIAASEIGPALLAVSDDGYNVIVGSTAANPILFSDYSQHPNRLIKINANLSSTAAGRYQCLHRYAVAYMQSLSLPDFGPNSQDQIALQQIRERGALPLIDAGERLSLAVARCSNIWASLPGNTYNQHQNSIDVLTAAYIRAGGALA